MNYQDLFQCLKGVGQLDLSGLVLPVTGTEYALYPINCRVDNLEIDIINMLTNARNANLDSFLTRFTATPERTNNWLTGHVATDSSRILFALKNLKSNQLYGYMGLAYGDSGGSRIEGDAIVRYAEHTEPGLMRLAFLHLVKWVNQSLGIDEIWVRVLSDNPAIGFYKQCHFVVISEAELYETRNSSGVLEMLTESPDENNLTISTRSLTYMKYLPSE